MIPLKRTACRIVVRACNRCDTGEPNLIASTWTAMVFKLSQTPQKDLGDDQLLFSWRLWIQRLEVLFM